MLGKVLENIELEFNLGSYSPMQIKHFRDHVFVPFSTQLDLRGHICLGQLWLS